MLFNRKWVVFIIAFTKAAAVLANPLLRKAFSKELISLGSDDSSKQDLIKILFGNSATSTSNTYALKTDTTKLEKLFTKTLIDSKKLKIILNLNTPNKYCALYISSLESGTYRGMFDIKNKDWTILTLEKEHEQKLLKLCQKDNSQIIQLSTILSNFKGQGG